MIDTEKQIQINKLTGENMFYVNSELLEENIEFINHNNIDYIVLNPIVGSYGLSDCNFLKEIPHIKKLDIVVSNIDIQGILFLKNLRELYLNVEKKQSFDFSSLDLKKINFQYLNGMIGLEKNLQLSEIIVSKADVKFLNIEIFNNFDRLEHLQIIQSKLPESLEFLKANRGLKDLEFDFCRTLLNFKNIDKLEIKLDTLKINNCKKVENIEVVSKLKSLKWFSLVDSVPLNDTSIVEALPNLETLVVLGSSYFLDGDLRKIKNRYKHFGIDKKKHYILN